MTIAELRAVASVIRQPIVAVSPGGEILVANDAAKALAGGLEAGNRLADLTPDPESTAASLRGWLRHGNPVPGRLVLQHPDGPRSCRADVARVELGDGPVVLIQIRQEQGVFARVNDRLHQLEREVSYRERLQQQRDEALRLERAAREQVERLHLLTSALAGALTGEDTVRAIRRYAPAAIGVDELVVVLEGDPASDAAPGAETGPVDGEASPGEPFADAITRQATVMFETPGELEARYPEAAGSDLAREPRLVGVVPLATPGGEPLGALGLRHGAGGMPPEGWAFARAVAAQCAQALERANLHDRERRFAENLQRALLPRRLPDIEGLGMAVRYLPATERAAVGGDWYDAIDLGDRRVALVVGDVAGHGQAAATTMAEMRSALRGLAMAFPTPAEVVGAFNQFVYRQLPAEMATVLYLVADLAAGTVSYTKAGHPPPLLIEAGEATYLGAALAPPVGTAPDTVYEEARRQLRPLWRIVAYTDGLVERRDEAIDVGLRRLARASVHAAGSAEALCEHVIASLVGGADLSDDAAVLVATGSTGPEASGRPRACTAERQTGHRAGLGPRVQAGSTSSRSPNS